ncbi:UNKNOWN [Stylonychia lemnae]|uniref:Uncharacterized protein n=1 Tax=Stylonychia lemnae TaxID=5949 RepID=A0A078A962_STYLE|nr:UNKNOWN [Stylonychia lemnae]|eukprot:CDW78107.1 UNKNOWN [Stylonychia lemnae]
MSNLDINRTQDQPGTTQITAKSFLQQNVFPKLEQSIELLLETIQRNGEFDKYVEKLAEKQDALQKEMRRRERDRKKLEMGEEYESSEQSRFDNSDDSSGFNSSDDSDYDSEGVSEEYDPDEQDSENQSEMNIDSSPSPSPKKKRRRNRERESTIYEIEEQFNALRFLGLTLKELNEGKQTRFNTNQTNMQSSVN